MKKKSFGCYWVIFCNTYQNNNKIGSDFPPTSGQSPLFFCSFDSLNWDPHMAYMPHLHNYLMTGLLFCTDPWRSVYHQHYRTHIKVVNNLMPEDGGILWRWDQCSNKLPDKVVITQSTCLTNCFSFCQGKLSVPFMKYMSNVRTKITVW